MPRAVHATATGIFSLKPTTDALWRIEIGPRFCQESVRLRKAFTLRMNVQVQTNMRRTLNNPSKLATLVIGQTITLYFDYGGSLVFIQKIIHTPFYRSRFLSKFEKNEYQCQSHVRLCRDFGLRYITTLLASKFQSASAEVSV